jgi:hypothetical protein
MLRSGGRRYRERHTDSVAIMTVYLDPRASGYPHPRLFVDLMARPSTVDLLPLELQITAALAWLADRSRPFALALLDAFFGADPGVGEQEIGARTRVTLPPLPPGGPLFPDLSIDVADHTLQLLVEVKVDATFHTHVLEDGISAQPDTYVKAWRRAAEQEGRGEARIRRVGTLSRTPADVPRSDPNLGDAHTQRAANISWHNIRDLIASVTGSGGFGELRSIAQEFEAALEQRILNQAGGVPIANTTLAWGFELLAAVLPAVVKRVSGASLGRRVVPQADYVGRYLRVDFGMSAPIEFWIYVTTADGRYNGGRAEANLWLSEHPDTRPLPDVRKQLATAGFAEFTDAAGTSLRRALPLSHIKAAGGLNGQHEAAIDWILRSLRQAGAKVIT